MDYHTRTLTAEEERLKQEAIAMARRAPGSQTAAKGSIGATAYAEAALGRIRWSVYNGGPVADGVVPLA